MWFGFCHVRSTRDAYPDADPQGRKSQVTGGVAELAVGSPLCRAAAAAVSERLAEAVASLGDPATVALLTGGTDARAYSEASTLAINARSC
jgi:hypothetical protein